MKWYYTVGEKTFVNRLEAVIHSTNIHQPVYFHAPDSYNNFDFSKPVDESLYSIASALANRLREKHDKITFWYSGGSDSDYMLDLFLKNKIKIDEIVCLKSGFKEADFEIDNFAIPKLNKVKDQLSDTVVKIMQPTVKDYENYYQTFDEEKIKKGCVNFATFIRLIQQNFFMQYKGGENDLVMIGREKPEIVNVNDQNYFYFVDVAIEPNPIIYNFFIDDPLINAKQSQLWLQSIKKGKSNTYPDDRVDCLYSKHPDDYPDKLWYHGKQDHFINYKSRKVRYHNTKEKFAIEHCIKNCPQIVDSWLKFLDQVVEVTGNHWWNEKTPEMLPVGIFSKFYGLDKKDVKTVDELYPNGFQN